ncbi:TetR/AcrR family transcriptional regulator [Pseudonocardia sp. DSM 110487]|uniref:TetR/AcrR family transcriptional regulator n=1 Tax=Pseudonocardia sp. DSM 110487 TaxID=2865833 RepID=UPI001C6A3091|nr:TetR/AcrR family transcriptional regulator [Pseudonocardia sp. DSM 110487]QYN35109.1 TetR/AcrR family transcriptional regulator [Pseudonocardia sp. DSM 110487]
MGNREDLLAGAITCLKEKGWARTTVRDIAAAAGVSHAAIGYHYGSREALLTAALIQAIDEWGSEIDSAVSARSLADGYETFWDETVRSYATHLPMWRATIDALLQAEHNPALRAQLSDGQRQGREGIAAGLLGIEESAVTDEQARTIGAVQSALISGVLMQHLLDPDTAPSGAEVVAGLRALAALTASDPADDRSRTPAPVTRAVDG